MGFFKRLFSGSKSAKSKRQRFVDRTELDPAQLARARQREEEETEATLARILRSSSSRYEVVSQNDYLTIPSCMCIDQPRAHRASTDADGNRPSAHHGSSASRASTPPPSIASKSTLHPPSPAFSTASAPLLSYNVTVHERQVHIPAILGSPRKSPRRKSQANGAGKSPKGKSPRRRSPQRRRSSLPSSSARPSPARRSTPRKPHATYSPDDITMTPNEKSMLLRLGHDPSVRNILEMYDANGRVRSMYLAASPEKPTVTSSREQAEQPPPSSPEPESETEEATTEAEDGTPDEDAVIAPVGRGQVQRSGSTLRQLLGVPDATGSRPADTTAAEGDLSWAERMLSDELGEGAIGDAAAFSNFLAGDRSGQANGSSMNVEADSSGDTTTATTSKHDRTLAFLQAGTPEPQRTATPDAFRSYVPTPVRAPSNQATQDSPPIQPASEVFAFLLAPRRGKASAPPLTTSAEDMYAPGPSRHSYIPPAPMPRVDSFRRQGPIGLPFASAAVAPLAFSSAGVQRARSHSAADVLAAESGFEPRRASSVASPVATRIPRGPRTQLARSGSLGPESVLASPPPPPVPPKDRVSGSSRALPRFARSPASPPTQPVEPQAPIADAFLHPNGWLNAADRRRSHVHQQQQHRQSGLSFVSEGTSAEFAEVKVALKGGAARGAAMVAAPVRAEKENVRVGGEAEGLVPCTPKRAKGKENAPTVSARAAVSPAVMGALREVSIGNESDVREQRLRARERELEARVQKRMQKRTRAARV